jgi:hypothetical protein
MEMIELSIWSESQWIDILEPPLYLFFMLFTW